MSDAMAEEWADNLLQLVEEEDNRADKKINQLRQPPQESGPELPAHLGIQDTRSLLRQHAGQQPRFPM